MTQHPISSAVGSIIGTVLSDLHQTPALAVKFDEDPTGRTAGHALRYLVCATMGQVTKSTGGLGRTGTALSLLRPHRGDMTART